MVKSLKKIATAWVVFVSLMMLIGCDALVDYGDSPSDKTSKVAANLQFLILSAGEGYTVAIDSNGNLYAWGRNNYGQLGDGTTADRKKHTRIGTDSDWISVSAGRSHTAALQNDGSLWVWGRNNYGQLGDGTATDRKTPIQIGAGVKWKSVFAGDYYTLAIDRGDNLWVWGRNNYGQLGDGTTTDRKTPVWIETDTKWKTVSTGDRYTLAIDINGMLWAWGDNEFGQLGDGTSGASASKKRPTQIGTDTKWETVSTGNRCTLAIDINGMLWVWGDNEFGQLGDGTTTDRDTPTQVGTDTWESVSAGGRRTFATRTDGSLWEWGLDDFGESGDGDDGDESYRKTPTRIKSKGGWKTISAGYEHMLAVMDDGSLWTWGDNEFGQLGDGTTTDKTAPTQITKAPAGTGAKPKPVAPAETASAGTGAKPKPIAPAGTASAGTGISQLITFSAGWDYSLAIDTDGRLYAWGRDGNRRLFGEGAVFNSYAPTPIKPESTWKKVSIGGSYAAAIDSDGKLWTWGANTYGQLGNGSTRWNHTPTQRGTATWRSVSAGEFHISAIDSDGKLWAWGAGSYGKVGDGTSMDRYTPTRIGNDTDWKSTVAGENYTVAMKDDGSIWAWGANGQGQLGDGTTTDRHTPTRIGNDTDWKSISIVGHFHTMAIKNDGSLWEWGTTLPRYGYFFDTEKILVPTQVGTDMDWESVSPTGFAHTMAIKNDGTLWAWGDNSYGQFGNGTRNNVQEMVPTQVGDDTDWHSVSSGGKFTIALKDDGSLWGWGDNTSGQVAKDPPKERPLYEGAPIRINLSGRSLNTPAEKPAASAAKPAEKPTASAAKPAEKPAASAAKPAEKPAASAAKPAEKPAASAAKPAEKPAASAAKPKFSGLSIARLSAGGRHTVAMDSTGKLWAWGNNEFGQLGDNTKGNNAYKTAPIQIGSDTEWKLITTGRSHTLAIDKNNKLYAWGRNDFGQLGDGNNGRASEKTTPVQIKPEDTWKSITAGRDHTVAIKNDGSLWAWGYNFYGQLGNGASGVVANKKVPVRIGTAANWKLLTAGSDHTLALDNNGKLYAWGYNEFGQLGDGSNTNRNTPIPIKPDTTWRSVSAGRHHTVAIDENGKLYIWGRNNNGQLGDGSNANKNIPTQMGTDTWKSVSAGYGHTVAVKNDGSLWAWGSNFYGQLGDGTTADKKTPTRIGTSSSWKSVIAGNYHTIAIDSNDKLWSWGRNDSGQLGLGPDTLAGKQSPSKIDG